MTGFTPAMLIRAALDRVGPCISHGCVWKVYLNKLLPAPANSRGNVVERVLSVDARVHDHTI